MGYLFADKTTEEMTLREAIDEVRDSLKDMDLTTQQAIAIVMKHVREIPEDCMLKRLTNICSYNETGCSDCKAKRIINDLMKGNPDTNGVLGKTYELPPEVNRLKALITRYANERGWINDSQFCVWIYYEHVKDFMNEFKYIFGNCVFDDGAFSANMQEDGVCIDLCEALEGYDFPFEKAFPKDEYAH